MDESIKYRELIAQMRDLGSENLVDYTEFDESIEKAMRDGRLFSNVEVHMINNYSKKYRVADIVFNNTTYLVRVNDLKYKINDLQEAE